MSDQIAMSSFVGRYQDLIELGGLLLDSHPLVTVVGPPGIGKTRLVKELAREWPITDLFCDLHSCSTASDVIASVAGRLSLVAASEQSDIDKARQVGMALANSGPTLVILDNVEHLVECLQEPLSIWLSCAADAQFLLTSRHRLLTDSEVTFDLRPLSLPDPECERSAEGALAGLLGSDAAQLFVVRAQAARSDYKPSLQDAVAVAKLVRQLDGLPLAIELAASRMRTLEPMQLLVRLRDHMELADRTSQTYSVLRSAIGWSWELLSSSEQQLIAQCSVFQSGFSVDAAEKILAAPDLDVLDTLQNLSDRSLIYTYKPSDATARRYGLYASIREYAQGELKASAAEDVTRRRHAEYYSAQALAWAERSYGSDRRALLGLLAIEQANIVAAHHWACSQNNSVTSAMVAIGAVAGLDPLLCTRGPLELLAQLSEAAALQVQDVEVSANLAARLAIVLGSVHLRRGLHQQAHDEFVKARRMAEASSDPDLHAHTLTMLGQHKHSQGDVAGARALLQQALDTARRSSLPIRVGRALIGLTMCTSDLSAAEELLGEAVNVLRSAGDDNSTATALANLGLNKLAAGQPHPARRHFLDSLETFGADKDRRAEAFVLRHLATIDEELGEVALAESRHHEALAALRTLGDITEEVRHLTSQAGFLHRHGRNDEARAAISAALPLTLHLADAHRAPPLSMLGVIESTDNDASAAEAAFSKAEALLSQSDTMYTASVLALQRGHLDLCQVRAALERGQVAEAATLLASARKRCTADLGSSSPALAWARTSLQSALLTIKMPPCQERAVMVVGPGCIWLQLPDGQSIDLVRRGSVRRIANRLVEQHVRAPGVAVSAYELFEAGWPGGDLAPDLGAKRVYTALWTLRKLGLRDCIVSGDEGYFLAPELQVQSTKRQP